MDSYERIKILNVTQIINGTEIINASRNVDPALIGQYQRNRNIEAPAFYILIFAYSVLILFGAAGNSLVVIAVVRKPVMRTARNMFILNLAIADLLLCLVTMPLTLVEILMKFWPFGQDVILCKMIGTLQAISIFVSTISITAIALDRYQVIVYPTRDSLQFMGAAIIQSGMWLFALILASPMLLFKNLVQSNVDLQSLGIDTVAFCIEDWPIPHGRVYYSAFSLFIQYLLPILIVSAAYLRIYFKLRNRIPINTTTATATATATATGTTTTTMTTTTTNGNVAAEHPIITDRNILRGRRMKKTNRLLISIAIIFGVSWLPLNIFNLFADIYLASNPMTQNILVGYAVCHMMGMSSACSNPLLYGWLNDNFRKEFKEILCYDRARTLTSTNSNGRNVTLLKHRRNGGGGGGDDWSGGSGRGRGRGGGGGGGGAIGGRSCIDGDMEQENCNNQLLSSNQEQPSLTNFIQQHNLTRYS